MTFKYGVSSEPLLRTICPDGSVHINFVAHSQLCEITRLMNKLQYDRFVEGESVILPDGRSVKEVNPIVLERNRA